MSDHKAVDASREDLSAKRLAFREIPIIDIAGLSSRDSDAAREVAAKIGDACRNVGFFYVSHHGVPAHVIGSLLEQTRCFFTLPLAEKMKYDITALQRHRGFVPVGGLTAAVDGKPDFQEAMEVGVELPEGDPDYLAGNMMYGPNVWPEHLPGFREGVYNYFEAAMNLGNTLARAFAITLRQPENYFEARMNKPITQLRLLYYPPQEDTSDELGIGVGTHCDYEMFTILLQDDAGGLQVMNTAGEWVEAPPIPDTFVINIGDMLMRWSNGEFRSTPHRVINTSGRKRYSFPMFVAANYDAIVRCLDTFVGPDRPAQFPPTQQGLWTVNQITDAYEYRRAYRGKVPSPERAAPA